MVKYGEHQLKQIKISYSNLNVMEFSLVFPTIATATFHGTTIGPANYWERLKDTTLLVGDTGDVGDTDPGA